MPRKPLERPYNNRQWTEARFWGFIRSALRRASQRWGPRQVALNRARRNYKGPGRNKYEYQCQKCKKWYFRKQVELDHIVPCGSLSCPEDLPGFVVRMFCEADGFQVLCKATCHHRKTQRRKK